MANGANDYRIADIGLIGKVESEEDFYSHNDYFLTLSMFIIFLSL